MDFPIVGCLFSARFSVVCVIYNIGLLVSIWAYSVSRRINDHKAFYRSANAIFGKVGRVASEEVVLQLINSKCMPSLLYGLEACPLVKSAVCLHYIALLCWHISHLRFDSLNNHIPDAEISAVRSPFLQLLLKVTATTMTTKQIFLTKILTTMIYC